MKSNEKTSDVAEENEGKPQESERQQRDQLRRQILEEARSKQFEKKIKKKARRKARSKKLLVAGTSSDQCSARSSLPDTSSSSGSCREQTLSLLQNNGSKVSSDVFDHCEPLALDADIFTYTAVKKSDSSTDLSYLRKETAQGGLVNCLLKHRLPRHLPLNASCVQLQKRQIQIIVSQCYTGADTSNEDLKPFDQIVPYFKLIPQSLQQPQLELILRTLLGEARLNAVMKKYCYQEMFTSLPSCPVMMEMSGLVVAAQKSDAVKECITTTVSKYQMQEFEKECKASDDGINEAAYKPIKGDCQSETDSFEKPQVMQLKNDENPPSTITQTMPTCNILKNSLANVDEIQQYVDGCPFTKVDVTVFQCSINDCQLQTSWAEVPKFLQCESDVNLIAITEAQLVPSCNSLEDSELANADEVSQNVEGCSVVKVDVAISQCPVDDYQSETSSVNMTQQVQCENVESPSISKQLLVPSCNSFDNTEIINVDEVSHSVCSMVKVDVAASQCSVDGCKSETSSVDVPQQMQCENDKRPSTSKPLLVPSCNSFDNTEIINVDEVSHSVEDYSFVDVPVNKSFTDGCQSQTPWVEMLQHTQCENNDKAELVPSFESSEFASVDVYQCSTDDCQSEVSWVQVPQPMPCENDASLPTTKAYILLSCSSSENSELANVEIAVNKCCRNDDQSETSRKHKLQHMQCENDESCSAATVQMLPSCNSFETSELANFDEVSDHLESQSLTAADSESQKDTHSLNSAKECVCDEDPLHERNVASEFCCPVEEEFVPDDWDVDLMSDEDVDELTNICVTADARVSVPASNTDDCQPETSWFLDPQPLLCENDESLLTSEAQIVLSCSSFENLEVVDVVSHNVESQSLANVDNVCHNVESQSLANVDDVPQSVESQSLANVDNMSHNVESQSLANVDNMSHNVESQSLANVDDMSHNIESQSLANVDDVSHGVESQSLANVDDVSHNVESQSLANVDDVSHGVESQSLANVDNVSHNVESQSLANVDDVPHNVESQSLANVDMSHNVESQSLANVDDVPHGVESQSLANVDVALYKCSTNDSHLETAWEHTLQHMHCENDESSPAAKVKIVPSCTRLENSELTNIGEVSHNVESQTLTAADSESQKDLHSPTSETEFIHGEDAINERNVASELCCPVEEKFVPDNWDELLMSDEDVSESTSFCETADFSVYMSASNTDDCQPETSCVPVPVHCEHFGSLPTTKAPIVLCYSSSEISEVVKIDDMSHNVENQFLANVDYVSYSLKSQSLVNVDDVSHGVESQSLTNVDGVSYSVKNQSLANVDDMSQNLESQSLANIDVALYKLFTNGSQSKTSWGHKLQHMQYEKDESSLAAKVQMGASCKSLENSKLTEIGELQQNLDGASLAKADIALYQHTIDDCRSETWMEVPQCVQCENEANHPNTKAQLVSSCNSFDDSQLGNVVEVSHSAESQPLPAVGSQSQKDAHNLTSGKEFVHGEVSLNERSISSELWCPVRQEFVPDNWDDDLLSDEDVTESASICVTADVSMSVPACGKTLFAGDEGNVEKLCKQQLLDGEISKQYIDCCQEVVKNGICDCHNKSDQSTNLESGVKGGDILKCWEEPDEVRLSSVTVPLHPNTAVMKMQQQEAHCMHKDYELNKPDSKWHHSTDGLVMGSERNESAGKVLSKHNGKVWQTRVVSNQNRLQRLQTANQCRQAEAEMKKSSEKAWLTQVVSNQNQPERLQTAEENDESNGKVSIPCVVGNETKTQRLHTAEQVTQIEDERSKTNVKVWQTHVSNEKQPQILQVEKQLTHKEEERNTYNWKVWPTQVVSDQNCPQKLQTSELLTQTHTERNRSNGKLWLSRSVSKQNQPHRLQTELLKHQLNGETEKELRNEKCESTSHQNKSLGPLQNSPIKNTTEDGIMLTAPELTVSNSSFGSPNSFIPVDLLNLKEVKVTDEYKGELGYSADIVEDNLHKKNLPNLVTIVNSVNDCSFQNMQNTCELDNSVHRQWESIPDCVSKVGILKTSVDHVLNDFRHQQKTEVPLEFNNNVYEKSKLIPDGVLNVGTAENNANHFKHQQNTEIPLEFNNNVYKKWELIPDSISAVAAAEASVNFVLSDLKHRRKTIFPPVFLSSGKSSNAEMYSDRQIFMSGLLPVKESTVHTNLNINSSPRICTAVPPTVLRPSPVHIASDNLGNLPVQSDLNRLVTVTLQKQQERLYLLLCDLQAKVLALARLLKVPNITKSPLAGRSDTDSLKNTGSLHTDKELSLEQIEKIIDRFVPVLNKHFMSAPEYTSTKLVPQNKHSQNTFSLQSDKKEKKTDQRELSDAELDNILKRLHTLGINDLKTPQAREQSTTLSVDQRCQERSLDSDGCFHDLQAHSRLPECPAATCAQRPTLRKTNKQLQTPLFQNKKNNKTVASCKAEAHQILQDPEIHRFSPEVTQGLQELRGQLMTKHLQSENLTVTPANTESFVTLNSLCKSTEEDRANIPECDTGKKNYKFFRGRMVKVPSSEPINKEKEILPDFTAVDFRAEVGHSLPTFKESSKSFSFSGSAPPVPRKNSLMQTKELLQFNYGFLSLSQRPVYTVSKTLPKKTGESYTKDSW